MPCACSVSTRSITTRRPRSSSTATSSRRPRRSGSAGASTASGRCRSRPGSCRSRPRPGAWTEAGLTAADLDAVAYSFDPALARPADELGLADPWDHLRTTYAQRAPQFLATALPGLDPDQVRYVPHHVAHAASAGLAAPHPTVLRCWCSTAAARRSPTWPAGTRPTASLTVLASQGLPHSLGLLYEDVTEHLGFLRSSDEYKVMALASYGMPRHLPVLREAVRATGDGGFRTDPIDWDALAKRRGPGEEFAAEHADLAASVQARLEEVLLRAGPLAARADRGPGADHGRRRRAQLRGQLAAGRRGAVRDRSGCSRPPAMPGPRSAGRCTWPRRRGSGPHRWPAPTWAAAGPTPSSRPGCDTARWPYERPADLAAAVADVLAADGVVAWFAGRSEYGPRALGHRSLLGNPGRRETLTGSTTSRAASSSGRSRRWSGSTGRPRCSTGRCPRRTCCSCTGSGPGGGTGSRPSCTSTAPRGCRPSTRSGSPRWPTC